MIRIEKATEANVPQILEFIRGLAEYERMEGRVAATEDSLRATLFGPTPYAQAVIVYEDNQPIAFAIYFFSYSTFSATPVLYLEDIFVKPSHRRSGIGRLLFSYLAKRALERGCGRLELSVLNWNKSAMDFYEQLGGHPVNEWTVFRFPEEQLIALADKAG